MTILPVYIPLSNIHLPHIVRKTNIIINVSWLDKPYLAETAFHEQDRW
jgi:hypothetical protein